MSFTSRFQRSRRAYQPYRKTRREWLADFRVFLLSLCVGLAFLELCRVLACATDFQELRWAGEVGYFVISLTPVLRIWLSHLQKIGQVYVQQRQHQKRVLQRWQRVKKAELNRQLAEWEMKIVNKFSTPGERGTV